MDVWQDSEHASEFASKVKRKVPKFLNQFEYQKEKPKRKSQTEAAAGGIVRNFIKFNKGGLRPATLLKKKL